MQKFNVLYFGIWGYGYYGLKALTEIDNINILSVFTRWNDLEPNSYLNKVRNLCLEKDINFINSDKSVLKKEEFENSIINFNDIDFIISCCFDRIFSDKVLTYPKIAALNLHPSLLPKYRGVKPLENSIIKENETGVTLHKLTKELDAGDIVIQKKGILIVDDKKYLELYEEQGKLIIDIIKIFFSDPFRFLENTYEQNKSLISLAPRLSIDINDFDTVRDIRNKYFSNNSTE